MTAHRKAEWALLFCLKVSGGSWCSVAAEASLSTRDCQEGKGSGLDPKT